MGIVIKSKPQDIQSVIGNGLNVFVDGQDGLLYLKDVRGNVQPILAYIPSLNYGLFSQTEDSVAITGTNVESSLIGNGMGALSVPANGFSVGDSFNCFLEGIISCVGTATIRIRVKTLSGSILGDTGIIDLNTSTLKNWSLNLQFTVRALGVAGVASISCGGIFSYIENSSNKFDGFVVSNVNTTTFDTTIGNTLVITAQWNTNNTGNSIFSRNFVLNKVY